jgi:hypothetical protein
VNFQRVEQRAWAHGAFDLPVAEVDHRHAHDPPAGGKHSHYASHVGV